MKRKPISQQQFNATARGALASMALTAMVFSPLTGRGNTPTINAPDIGDNQTSTRAPAYVTPTVPLPPPVVPIPVAQENGKPIWGVFTSNDPKAVLQYEAWLGRPTDAILSYTGDANWQDYDGSVGWAAGIWSKIDRRVLWSVPLIPQTATLAEAATGAYNDHWKRAALALAKWHPNEPVIYIRTGWEFNGRWFHDNAIHQPQNFIGAWRQFVSVFRSVSPRFRFDWCPAGPDNMGMRAEDAYPGDDYVDIIGLDIYDQTIWCKIQDPSDRWNIHFLNGSQGLLWHRNFAALHHKPMSYPEWGACGNGSGDNPYFILQMHRWFLRNHVIYATYWDSNSSYKGRLSGNQYPIAGAKYKELLGSDDPNPALSSGVAAPAAILSPDAKASP